MRSVVIANSSEIECEKIKKVLGNDYHVRPLLSPAQKIDLDDNCDLIVLDHNFTDQSGIDFLEEVMGKTHIPVLMVTSPDEPQPAIEAIRKGAYNYLVKTSNYLDLLTYTIREAIDKFNEREQMKQTIIDLKNRVAELERQLGAVGEQPEEVPPGKEKVTLIEEITSRFKRGEINLPAYPAINVKFRRLEESGATIGQITDLLKQDMGISSKLLSISNSPYYCGLTKNTTLEQAVSRLGLKTTKNYVELISNRSLYATNNLKFRNILRKLWEHSLSCAYASEILSNHLRIAEPDEVFIMGLLHDIGKLLLLQIAIEMDTKEAYDRNIGMEELHETLDAYHGVFGGSLLRKWKFPGPFVLIARHHNHIEGAETTSKELMVVHLANIMVKSLGYDLNGSAPPDPENSVSANFLRLSSQELTQVEEHVKQLMENSSTLL